MGVSKTSLIASSTFLAGLVVGGLAGSKFVYKGLEAQFEERLQKELAETLSFIEVAHKKEYPTPQEAVEKLVEVPEYENLASTYKDREQKVSYNKVVKPAEKEVVDKPIVNSNVFEKTSEGQGDIYLIAEAVFNAGELDYVQSTLTYYEGDDILADQNDVKIEDLIGTVGSEFHTMFGWQSDDPNTMHIRNDKLSIDFEIVKNTLAYSEVVDGLNAGG